MSQAKIMGIVHVLEDTKTVGKKGFRKRTLVLEQDNGRFTNYIPIEFLGDACDSADEISVGDQVEVNYRLSGRKWQRDPQSEVKYFLSAEVVSFQVLGGAGASQDPQDANSAFDAAYDSDEETPF